MNPKNKRSFVFILVVASALIGAHSVRAAEPITIVALGDSITKGVRTGVKADETFSAYLEALLKKQGYNVKVVNIGIGGERTDQALSRLERDVVAHKPAIVTIMYGTNDSYVDIGAKASRLSANEFKRNLVELVNRLRTAKIVPVLMTEPCHGDRASANGVGEHPNLRLDDFMKACRAVAQELKVSLVDNYQVWSDHNAKGTDVGSWTTDQCHPNPEGHRLIAETMLPIVVETLKTSSK